MDTPDPSADQGGGGAGAARPENSSGSGGFEPAALPMAIRLRAEQSSTGGGAAGAGAARTGSSVVQQRQDARYSYADLLRSYEESSADALEFNSQEARLVPGATTRWLPGGPGTAALAGISTDLLPGPSAPPEFSEGAPLPVTSTDGHQAPPTALEQSTLRLASGLEFMNLTGGEPPAVEGPSTSTTTARKRTPGKWRRIPRPKRATEYLWRPRDHSPCVKAMMDECDLITLKNIEQIENMREEDCDILTEQDRLDFYAFKKKMVPALRGIVDSKPENTFFTYTKFSDTKEEHLTAEGMEAQVLAQFPDRKPCEQAKYFAEIAMEHYNEKKKHKYKLATTLLSNCFSESSGTTYGHVNFTGILQEKTTAQPTSHTKRLFFAELMLIPKLQYKTESRPMRVVHVYTIDDDSCYGGCHEMFRKIDNKMRHDMDYERCHACSDRIKHPKGQLFDGGHNSSRMPYYSAI